MQLVSRDHLRRRQHARAWCRAGRWLGYPARCLCALQSLPSIRLAYSVHHGSNAAQLCWPLMKIQGLLLPGNGRPPCMPIEGAYLSKGLQPAEALYMCFMRSHCVVWRLPTSVQGGLPHSCSPRRLHLECRSSHFISSLLCGFVTLQLQLRMQSLSMALPLSTFLLTVCFRS